MLPMGAVQLNRSVKWRCSVTSGFDTLCDVKVAAVVDMNGGLLGVESFRTTADGHKMLASWMAEFEAIERVGVEGTGTYGASVARHLARMSVTAIEVDRPNRQQRRQHGSLIGSTRSKSHVTHSRAAAPTRALGHHRCDCAACGRVADESDTPLAVNRQSGH